MSGNIEFGHAEGALGRIAERVIQAKGEFKKEADVLDGQIQGLKGSWVGDGGTAFMTLHNAWTEKHGVVTAALDQFHASLTETESDNTAVDQAQSADLRHLMDKLGDTAAPN